MVYLWNGILFSTKNEQIAHTCNNMDKPQKYYARKKDIYVYDCIYRKYLEKTILYRWKQASGCPGLGIGAGINCKWAQKVLGGNQPF